MQSVELEIRNPAGLHARPAAMFFSAARKFHSTVTIENLSRGGAPVKLASLLALLGAQIRKGDLVRITAEGADEAAAIERLRTLVESGIGERIDEAVTPASGPPASGPPASGPPASGPPATPARAVAPAASLAAPARSAPVAGRILGTAGAPGIANGAIWRYAPSSAAPSTAAPADPASAIHEAVAEATRQLEELAERVRAAGRDEEAGIFEAQALMASDPALCDEAISRAVAGEPITSAVQSAAAAAAATLAAMPDELLAARAADVRDVGARIVRILTGERLDLPAVPSIAVAEDLPPSVTAEIPGGLLLGIALEGGSRTAHAVILARGLGIPAVVGARGLLEGSAAAERIAIDGGEGEILVDPSALELAALEGRARAAAERAERAATLRGRPGATSDGRRVILAANIGVPGDAPRALAMGAEGVGLFRTEFLYMRRATPPTEDEQVAAYADVLRAFGPDRPVVIRLADIGGDKAIPYLRLPPEANPFLGVRAIRLGYDAAGSRELLATQLRAIWRAGGETRVVPHVMAPMVATIADVELFHALRDEAREAVAARGERCAERMVAGIMIEIPAAALLAGELARLVDFFSIGTNDLTQYTMAADRGNAALGSLQDALHPAVLRLISSVVRGAREGGIPVAVCGELAADPAGALVLVGLGVGELSADAAALDGVRMALASTTSARLEELAERALGATDAPAVRGLAAPLLAGSAEGPAT